MRSSFEETLLGGFVFLRKIVHIVALIGFSLQVQRNLSQTEISF